MLGKKTICFIAPSLQLGGLENAAALMANYISAQHKELVFITLFNFPHFYKLNSEIKIVNPPFIKARTNKLAYYFKVIKYLRFHIKSYDPYTVISYGDWSNILVLIACIGLNTKVFISDRASPNLKFQWYVTLLRKIIYLSASGIIAQTERAAEQKIKMLGSQANIKVIPNPIKQVHLFPAIQRQNYILGVGRHWPVKGFDRLIEAFALLKNHNYKLLIAGSTGPVTKELEKLIEMHALTERVSLLGSVKEMDKLSAECKIFVLPSRSEGFPNALIESMAAGLACISYDCNAGPREIITHGQDGLLVEEGNIPELARQMQYLMDNENEIIRLGQNALRIRERLSIDIIGKQYLDFILS